MIKNQYMLSMTFIFHLFLYNCSALLLSLPSGSAFLVVEQAYVFLSDKRPFRHN